MLVNNATYEAVPMGQTVNVDHWLALLGGAVAPTIHDDLEQGSLEWKLERASRFTASELPGMASESKWVPRNPREVLRVKRGDLVIRDNPAMARGRNLEPIARRMVEESLGIELPPAVMSLGHLMASLDGWNAETRTLVEIKCPMKAEFSDGVPTHYWAQLAMQAVICDPARVFFVEYIGGIVQAIQVDPAMLRQSFLSHYAPILAEYLPHLLAGTLPPGGIETRTDENWSDFAARYIECKRIADEAAELLESARTELLALAGDDGAEGAGVKVQYVTRPGNVNWKAKEITAALAAAGVDPDAFRGKAIRSARITIGDENSGE